MQFSLKSDKVRLVHKNERLEMHGEDQVLACDLDFEFETKNDVLSEFSPDLRSILYRKPDGVQGELVEGDLSEVRFPQLGKVRWDEKQKGVELKFHRGRSVALAFPDCDVAKFSFDCREGGTVVVHFQVRVLPDEGQSGKISGFLKDQHCLVSLTPAGEAGEGRPTE